MLEMPDGDVVVSDLHGHLPHRRVRDFEELIEEAELVHQLERRGMHGVAAEVAQEILMLLQQHNTDACAREKKSEHHPGGAAADHAAGRFDFGHRHSYCFPSSEALLAA